jgi:hypothetical protein
MKLNKVAINPSCIPVGKLQDLAKKLAKKYGWKNYGFEWGAGMTYIIQK